MTDSIETIPGWVQGTQRRSPAINFWKAALRLSGLVCFHLLGMELSSYYGSTHSKATTATNCCELLRHTEETLTTLKIKLYCCKSATQVLKTSQSATLAM